MVSNAQGRSGTGLPRRRPRVIPVLLLNASGGLVKTIRFGKRTYIGDPINAVKIFNDKGVDELVLLDIDATTGGREPNYSMVEDIVSEAFMPLGYGGGVTTVEQMKRLFRCGLEKVVVSTAAREAPGLIANASAQFGAQSVVVCLDVKKNWFGKTSVNIRSGKTNTKLGPAQAAIDAVGQGAGELIVYSIDRDGTYQGYDEQTLRQVVDAVDVPVVACGGASSLEDCVSAIRNAGCSAVAAGSMFVYQGNTRGVLISYPTESDLQSVYEKIES